MKLTWKENHPPGGERQGWIAEFPGGVATIATGRDWRGAIDGPGSTGTYNDAELYLVIRRHGEKAVAESAAFVRTRKPVYGGTVEAAMAAALEYLKQQAEAVHLLDPAPRAEAPLPNEVHYAVFNSESAASADATALAADGWALDGPPVPVVIGDLWRILQRFVRRV